MDNIEDVLDSMSNYSRSQKNPLDLTYEERKSIESTSKKS